jgi:hypothetical protein
MTACACPDPHDAIAAAPDGGTEMPATAAEPISLPKTFCQGTFGVRKRLADQCCSPADLAGTEWNYEVATLSSANSACTGDLSASLALGRIALDAPAIRICLGEVAAQPTACSRQNVLLSLPKSCASAVRGLQDSSAPCAHDYECMSGLKCNGHSGTTDGRCAPPAQTSKACIGPVVDAGVPSVFELPLGGDHPACAGGGVCNGGKCQPGGIAPYGCSFSGSPGPCRAGLACVIDVWRCVPTDGSLGSACDHVNTPCNYGLGCSFGTCVALKSAGEACDCVGNECAGTCRGPCTSVAGASTKMIGTCAAVCGPL